MFQRVITSESIVKIVFFFLFVFSGEYSMLTPDVLRSLPLVLQELDPGRVPGEAPGQAAVGAGTLSDTV